MNPSAHFREAARTISSVTTELLELASAVERGTVTSTRARAVGLTVSGAVHTLEEVKPQIRRLLRGHQIDEPNGAAQ